MSRRLENNNGEWYLTETLPLESVIKNLADNPTFKLETVESRPKISFNVPLPKYIDSEVLGYNEYQTVRVVSQLSANHSYWSTKIWLFNQSDDNNLNELAVSVLESENPDIYHINEFSEIVDILAFARKSALHAAVHKKYYAYYPKNIESKFILNSVSRANDKDKSAPLIILRGVYDTDISIQIKIDIFEGKILTLYQYNDRQAEHEDSLPYLWARTRKSLMGSNSDPNSVANSLRLAMFLDNSQSWSEPELICDALKILVEETCKELKNVV